MHWRLQESGYDMKNRYLDAKRFWALCPESLAVNSCGQLYSDSVLSFKLNGNHNGLDGPGSILSIVRFLSSRRAGRLWVPPILLSYPMVTGGRFTRGKVTGA